MNEKLLVKSLKNIISEGDGAFFSLFGGKYHMQITTSNRGEKKIYIDAVSNAHLPAGDKLTDDQMNKIKAMGFSQPSEKDDFALEIDNPMDQIEKVAQTAIQVFSDVYGVKSHQVELEEPDLD